ncbi:acyl carrier protein [Streptomyces sp. NPDC058989]|uniref:acyl carrier protein n=1 Tax=Streptomyces sp. NPDC058989 TaxID=3346686 RepID=UPI003685D584
MDDQVKPPTLGRAPDADQVLSVTSRILEELLQEYADEIEITRRTRFLDDLEIESVDLVVLAGRLRDIWGVRVDFPRFISGLELSEILELTVGEVVDYVVMCLADVEKDG